MGGFNKNSSFNFNYSVFTSAAKSTTFSPCCHPVKCDLCHLGFYWSYNLKINYQQNRPSICFPDDKVISNQVICLKKTRNL
jgi:hypothetical protein